MKILKKYTFTMFLLLLTTMIAPLNANLADDLLPNDLINKEELRKWCKQYISEKNLNTIETGLKICFVLSTIAFMHFASSGWVAAQGRMIERGFKANNPEAYKAWCLKNGKESI